MRSRTPRENVNELRTAVTLALMFKVLQSCVEQTTYPTAPRLLVHHIDVVRNFETGRGWACFALKDT